MLHQILYGVSDIIYKDVIGRLNFLSFHMTRRHLGALFLISALKESLLALPFWIQ